MRAIALAAGLAATSALASPTPLGQGSTPGFAEDFDRATLPNVLRLDVGIGSALGEAGLSYTRLFGDHLELEIGFGLGVTGGQLSAMPKLCFGSLHDRYVFGAGMSIAVPGAKSSEPGAENDVAVPWINLDLVGYEHRSPNGFAFLIAAGTTTALADAELPGFLYSKPQSLKDFTMAQVRVGFGFSM